MDPSICFVTAHPNPANHFVQFIQTFEEKEIPYKVIAGKNVSDKFHGLKNVVTIDLSSLEGDGFSEMIESEIASQSVVITDIANKQWATLHEILANTHPSIKRAVYYDNPEKHVPGGYSQVAAELIEQAQIVLFANASHPHVGVQSDEETPIDLSEKETLGIGYYPTSDAIKIQNLRSTKASEIRSALFEKHSIIESGQNVLTYIGGANETYYEKAFPHFMKLLSDLIDENGAALENTVFILQQHPRAKIENIDAKLVQTFLSQKELPAGFQIIVSDIQTNESLAISKGAYYYQTSMNAQLVFANVPTVAQIGHEPYPDLLVRSGFPSITESSLFAEVLSSDHQVGNVDLVEKELGMIPDWKENLLKLTD
jgi:hypothetical protein